MTPTAPRTLETLQTAFQRHLLDEANDFSGMVAEGGRIGVQRRLAIYHNAYRARLVETLRDGYGHTLSYLGEEGFDAAARAYLKVHPSTHPNLRWFGAAFADWLLAACPEDPDIGELASLDWALRRAFDAADAPVLGLGELAALPGGEWARVGFAFQPSCQRLRLRHNTLAIWQAIDQDGPPPQASLLERPTELLIWRRGLQPHFRSLGPLEASALDRLLAGAGFAATCDALDAEFPGASIVAETGALLRRWIEEELLSGLVAPS